MKRSDVYTTGQFAKICKLNRFTVWNHIKQGHLHAIQFDDRGWHYIRKEEADRWIKWRNARRAAGDYRLIKIKGAA